MNGEKFKRNRDSEFDICPNPNKNLYCKIRKRKTSKFCIACHQNPRKGKTYIEFYGEEKAKEILKKNSDSCKSFLEKNPSELNKRKDRCKNNANIYNIWLNKFGKEKADLLYKNWLSHLNGFKSGNENIAKKPEIRKVISQKKQLYWDQNPELKTKLSKQMKFGPNFNKKACFILDRISDDMTTIIQHAMNYGEYYIRELGYWVDGYSKEINAVFEFYERHHFENGKLKEKDLLREQRIIKFLNCRFYRIYENLNIEEIFLLDKNKNCDNITV